jgi:hypothetical protein
MKGKWKEKSKIYGIQTAVYVHMYVEVNIQFSFFWGVGGVVSFSEEE